MPEDDTSKDNKYRRKLNDIRFEKIEVELKELGNHMRTDILEKLHNLTEEVLELKT